MRPDRSRDVRRSPHSTRHIAQQVIDEVRARWKRRALIQGGALTLLVLLFGAAVLLVLYGTFGVSADVVLLGLIPVGLLVLGVLVAFVIRPALQKIDDRQVALYIEEQLPDLEDRLNSAIEVDDPEELRTAHGALLDKLIDDAAQRARTIPVTTVVDRKRERLLAYGAAGALFLFLLFGSSTLGDLRVDLSGSNPFQLVAAEMPLMTVQPGNIEVEKGAAQEVIVALREDTDREVTLNYKEGDGAWQKVTMRPALGRPEFIHEFPSVQEPTQYFVEYDQTPSDTYTISIYEYPQVDRIDLRYTYPSYTGVPVREEENTGDIRGLQGSTVTVTVSTNGTAETGALVLESGDRIDLDNLGDGRFQGSLTLQQRDSYTVELTDAQAKQNKFPVTYLITPEPDERPRISVTDPQRDVRVNAIEEVRVAAEAQDDYGVKALRLQFSVNGEEEQSLALADVDGRPLETDGDHLFFLEDYTLEPGDVISYYIEAEDHFHEDPEVSDMYFIEVLPFGVEYEQAANMGGMQGGGQPSGIVLSQQQIIAATWNLIRQRADVGEAEFDETLRGLVQAQANLKNNIEERINSTAFSLELQASEENRQVVEFLRAATGEMDAAIEELEPGRLREALTPERRALNQLLKADALNKERQVAMSRQQQGGGGGGATEERMTELMDLELDISKDKYETQQQQPSGGGQAQQEMDETLQKLKELARRQQRLANQNQRREAEEDPRRYVERLQRDQEQLREQTEELQQAMQQMSRDGQLSRQSQESLQRAIDNMREAERAMRRGDEQQAQARQQQAMNELDRLQQDMQMAGAETTREMLEDFAQNFDQLREQERQLGEDIEEAYEETQRNNGRIDPEQVSELRERRENLRDELDMLQRQAEALESRARMTADEDEQEVANAMRNLLQRMERDELSQKVNDSETALQRGWVDYAERLQDEINTAMEGLDTQVRDLEGRLPQTDEEQLRRALADVQDLMERVEEWQRRADERAQDDDPSSGSQPSPQGQQNQQGQQGQQQDQQSQQGQQQSGQPGGQSGMQPDSESAERAARADAARMRREAQQAMETLDRLRDQMGGSPEAQQSLGPAYDALRRAARADHTGTLLDPEAAKDYFNENVYRPLSQLEAALASQLDGIELEKKLFGARKADVPSEYRDLVDKYYETLSQDRE